MKLAYCECFTKFFLSVKWLVDFLVLFLGLDSKPADNKISSVSIKLSVLDKITLFLCKGAVWAYFHEMELSRSENSYL